MKRLLFLIIMMWSCQEDNQGIDPIPIDGWWYTLVKENNTELEIKINISRHPYRVDYWKDGRDSLGVTTEILRKDLMTGQTSNITWPPLHCCQFNYILNDYVDIAFGDILTSTITEHFDLFFRDDQLKGIYYREPTDVYDLPPGIQSVSDNVIFRRL